MADGVDVGLLLVALQVRSHQREAVHERRLPFGSAPLQSRHSDGRVRCDGPGGVRHAARRGADPGAARPGERPADGIRALDFGRAHPAAAPAVRRSAHDAIRECTPMNCFASRLPSSPAGWKAVIHII